MSNMRETPPGGYLAGFNDSAAFLEKSDDISPPPANKQEAFARLAEIKLDSIWRLARTAREHLDRLMWALDDGDAGEVRTQCRSVVSHVRAVAILCDDLHEEDANG